VYRPLLAPLTKTQTKDGIIATFYSHDLKAGDVFKNTFWGLDPTLFYEVDEILERRDATGEWADDWYKNLWCRARIKPRGDNLAKN